MSPPVSPTVSTTDVVNGDPSNPSANGTGVGKRYRTQPAKTFQCRGYGDCRMVFSRSEHLARHVRKHTGERPFTCHCSKQFSRLDNLRQHAQTVHADKQEQNETLMRDLTSLHTAMAVGKGRKRTSASSSSVNINANTSPVSQPTSPTVQGTGRTDVKLESEHPPHNRNLEYPGLASYNGHITIPNAHTGGVARPGTTAGYEASSYYSQAQPSRPFRTSSDDSISSQSQSFQQQQQQQTNHSFPSPISPPPHSSQRYTTHGHGGQSFQNSHSFSHLHQHHPNPHAHAQDSFRAESPSSNSVVSPLSALPALPTPPPPAPNSNSQHSFPGAVGNNNTGPGSRGSPSGESNSGGSAGNGGGGGYTPVPSPHGGVGQGQSFRPHPFEHAAYNPLAHSHHSGGGHSFRGHGHGHEGDSHSFLGSGNGSPGRTLPSFTTLVSSGASNAYSHSLGGGSGEGSGKQHQQFRNEPTSQTSHETSFQHQQQRSINELSRSRPATRDKLPSSQLPSFPLPTGLDNGNVSTHALPGYDGYNNALSHPSRGGGGISSSGSSNSDSRRPGTAPAAYAYGYPRPRTAGAPLVGFGSAALAAIPESTPPTASQRADGGLVARFHDYPAQSAGGPLAGTAHERGGGGESGFGALPSGAVAVGDSSPFSYQPPPLPSSGSGGGSLYLPSSPSAFPPSSAGSSVYTDTAGSAHANYFGSSKQRPGTRGGDFGTGVRPGTGTAGSGSQSRPQSRRLSVLDIINESDGGVDDGDAYRSGDGGRFKVPSLSPPEQLKSSFSPPTGSNARLHAPTSTPPRSYSGVDDSVGIVRGEHPSSSGGFVSSLSPLGGSRSPTSPGSGYGSSSSSTPRSGVSSLRPSVLAS